MNTMTMKVAIFEVWTIPSFRQEKLVVLEVENKREIFESVLRWLKRNRPELDFFTIINGHGIHYEQID